MYDYAFTMVEGKTAADMPDVLHETFTKTISESRATPPEAVGPGYSDDFGWIRAASGREDHPDPRLPIIG